MNQDSKNIATLTWVGTLFLGFIPSLVVYLLKKDDAYIQSHAKEALNWCITAIIGYIAGAILAFIGIGGLIMLAVGIAHLVFSILGAVKASQGNAYTTFVNLRLIK